MPPHFSDASLRFLRGLRRNNDRDWFNERKPAYERDLKAPLLDLIEVVNEALLRCAPEYVRSPAKTMLRIYRDIRFSSDKRPYKTHVSAWWPRSGLERISGAGFYFQFGPEGLILAAGVYMPEREQLLAIRRHLVTHHDRLRTEFASRRLRSLGLREMEGRPLSRPPKGFTTEAAAIDLLVRREWGVSATLPVEAALGPALARDVISRFQRCVPLVTLLNEPLSAGGRRPLVGPLSFRLRDAGRKSIEETLPNKGAKTRTKTVKVVKFPEKHGSAR